MTPIIHQTYQHRYGGVYIVDSVATHTTTKERVVVYTHIYPFAPDTWVRPYDEFCDGRFTQISASQVQDLLDRDRTEFQESVNQARRAAKG